MPAVETAKHEHWGDWHTSDFVRSDADSTPPRHLLTPPLLMGREIGGTSCRLRSCSLTLALIAPFTTLASSPGALPRSFEGLGFLPGQSSSEANAVSADGSVVIGRSLPNTTTGQAVWGQLPCVAQPVVGMSYLELRPVLSSLIHNAQEAPWQH